MHERRWPLIGALISALLMPLAAHGELIHEHFNHGGGFHTLGGWSGDAVGWDGPWEGINNAIFYDPMYAYMWHQDGYSNLLNNPTQGSARQNRLSPQFRRFTTDLTNVSPNLLWMSAIPVGGDSVMFGGHFNNAQAFFGLRNHSNAIRTFIEFYDNQVLSTSAFGPPLGPGQPCGVGVCANPNIRIHLFIAKLEFDYNSSFHDRITVWVDPPDLLNGEAGLGPPDAMLEGENAWGSWNHFFLQLQGSGVDAIRVSYNGATPPSLEDVLRPLCGDTALDGDEECDDGNRVDGDGCSHACRDETCSADGACESVTEDIPVAFTEVTTDSEGDGATAADGVETWVTPPAPGVVSIVESVFADEVPPAGFSLLNRNIRLTVPPATSVLPIQLIFELHQSLASPPGGSSRPLGVLRNGEPVRGCSSVFSAVPDPCVWRHDRGANHRFYVRTSRASIWSLGFGGCSLAPLDSCRQSAKSTFVLKNNENDVRDSVVWTWTKGEATPESAFGDPRDVGGEDYVLCLYDESDMSAEPLVTEILRATALAGTTCGRNDKACWKALGNPPGSKGFRYSNGAAAPDGLTTVLLKPGDDGASKVVVKGKGDLLAMLGETDPDASLPFDEPAAIRVQLQATNGECWEAAFGPDDIKKNIAEKFRAVR